MRELVRSRGRPGQVFGDRGGQLHRLVDLGVPEFLRYVRDLGGESATASLRDSPTAAALRSSSRRRSLERRLDRHEVGPLLTTIDGIGPQAAARRGATFGDVTGFPSGATLAAPVGVIPALRQSGARPCTTAALTPVGAAGLLAELRRPGLAAVRTNLWLRASDSGLIARDKRPRVAVIAPMRKLLHAVYSAAIHRRLFAPHPVGQEASP